MASITELIISSELSQSEQRRIIRLYSNGEIHRIVPGIYTSLPESDWPALLKANRLRILASVFPGAVLGYKTAFSGNYTGPEVFLNYKNPRVIALPGFTAYAIKNAGPIDHDRKIGGANIYFPSEARMLLDNVSIDRSGKSRNVDRGLIEERITSVCASRGEVKLLELRDQINVAANLLGKDRERDMIDGIIGAILNTKKNESLTSPSAKAWQKKYDLRRVQLFDSLVTRLKNVEPKAVPEKLTFFKSKRNFAFIESYFSNFIEGTEFEVSVAMDIALNEKIVALRPKDSHDIKGVFDLAADSLSRVGTLPESVAINDFLLGMHKQMMAARPEVNPGEFKIYRNQAGNTYFVEPEFVRGTLIEAAKRLVDVRPGIHRALYGMFMISEIHPFTDGNGRISRLCMNAELSRAGQGRILVPILLRDEYMDCLRVLTRQGDPGPFFKVMLEAQAWSSMFDFEDIDQVIDQMRKCNAFEKSRADFKLVGPGGESYGSFAEAKILPSLNK